jgi:hypothetical protein
MNAISGILRLPSPASTNILRGENTSKSRNRIYCHWVEFVLELIAQLVIFALFASAYPDRYRSLLWLTGGIENWNSNPELRVYFYATT